MKSALMNSDLTSNNEQSACDDNTIAMKDSDNHVNGVVIEIPEIKQIDNIIETSSSHGMISMKSYATRLVEQ